MPGRWLLAIARAVLDENVVEIVVSQTIADMRDEWLRAGTDRGARHRARWNGYFAFWKVVVMSPLTTPSSLTSPRESKLAGFSIVAATLLVVGLTWRPDVARFLAPLLNSLPEGTMSALGVGRYAAVLAGPVLLIGMALWRRRKGVPAGLQPATIMLAGLVSMSLTVLLSAAALVGAFEGIAESGNAGLGVVTDGIVSAMRPNLLALATVIVLAGTALVMSRKVTPEMPRLPPPTRRSALALSLVVALTALALDRLLSIHHVFAKLVLSTFVPVGRRDGNMMSLMRMFEQNTGLVLLGSALLTVVAIAGCFAAWKTSRSRLSHPLMTGVVRVVAILVIAGGIWHAAVITSDLDAYRDNVKRMQSIANRR